MNNIRVLVACEESQLVTIAFRARGFDAFSCDIQDCSGGHPEWHIKDDVLAHLNDGWDLMIAHPPCTYLSYVGMRHWNKPGRAELRASGMKFFMQMVAAPINHIAVENPLGEPNKSYRKPDQTIHPYFFGDSALKRTCLWLKNLPRLEYSLHENMFYPRTGTDYPEPMAYLKTTGKAIHWTEYKHGGAVRSKSWRGIANAMAEQWGNYLLEARGVTE